MRFWSLRAREEALTFEEYYQLDTNPKRKERYEYWKNQIPKKCTCEKPNNVFPEPPCDVFRATLIEAKGDPPKAKYNSIVKAWVPEDYRKWYADTYRIVLKTSSEWLAELIPADRAAEMALAKKFSDNERDPARRALKDEWNQYNTRANKLERINHRVPKEAGGCPGAPPSYGNLQPQQTLCAFCQSIDQEMTDDWQG